MSRKGSLACEQTSVLIRLVKESPAIWNPEDITYNDRLATTAAWAAIAKEMELPEELLRNKWKNLRDFFLRECRRLNGTEVDDYLGKWRHFKKMWFLYRASYLAISQGTEEADPVEACVVKMEPENDLGYGFLDESQDCEKRKDDWKSDPVDASENGSLEEPLEKQRRTESYNDEDCDVMFLKSLTPYFKLLKPIRRLVMRNKIQEMLLSEITQGTVKAPL